MLIFDGFRNRLPIVFYAVIDMIFWVESVLIATGCSGLVFFFFGSFLGFALLGSYVCLMYDLDI